MIGLAGNLHNTVLAINWATFLLNIIVTGHNLTKFLKKNFKSIVFPDTVLVYAGQSCPSSAVATPRHCISAAAAGGGVSSSRLRHAPQTITDASGKLAVCQSLPAVRTPR